MYIIVMSTHAEIPDDIQHVIKTTASMWKQCEAYHSIACQTNRELRQAVDQFFWCFMDEMAETVEPNFVAEIMSTIIDTMETVTGPFYMDPTAKFSSDCVESIRDYYDACEETRRRCMIFLRINLIPTFVEWIDRLETHIYNVTGNAPFVPQQWHTLLKPFTSLLMQWSTALYRWVDACNPTIDLTRGEVIQKTEALCRTFRLRIPIYVAVMVRPQTGRGAGAEIQSMIDDIFVRMFDQVKSGWAPGDSMHGLEEDWTLVACSLRRYFYHGLFESMAEIRDRIEYLQDENDHPNLDPRYVGEWDMLEELFGYVTRIYRKFKEDLARLEEPRA